jgi:hypothetical protein
MRLGYNASIAQYEGDSSVQAATRWSSLVSELRLRNYSEQLQMTFSRRHVVPGVGLVDYGKMRR